MGQFRYVGYNARLGKALVEDEYGNIQAVEANYNKSLNVGEPLQVFGGIGNQQNLNVTPDEPETIQSTQQLILPKEPVPVNIAILFFKQTQTNEYYYVVGGHQEEPIIVYSELDEIAFPPTRNGEPNNSVLRGIDFGGDYEISNFFFDTPNFRFYTYTPMGYQSTNFSVPSIPEDLYLSSLAVRAILLENANSGVGTLAPGTGVVLSNLLYYRNELTTVETPASSILESENSFINVFDYPSIDRVDLQAHIGLNFRNLGGGYKMSSILLQERIYTTTQSTTLTSDGTEYVEAGKEVYIDIPPEYHYKIFYYQPTDDLLGTELVTVEPTTISKNNYSYSIPLAQQDGRFPLQDPTTSLSLSPVSNPTDIKFTGESYYWIGSEETYITEYRDIDTSINKNDIEFRMYSQGTFFSNLAISNIDIQGIIDNKISFYIPEKNSRLLFTLSDKNVADIITLETDPSPVLNPISTDLIGQNFKCVSHENTPIDPINNAWQAFGTLVNIENITQNATRPGFETTEVYWSKVTIQLTTQPEIKSFIRSSSTIFRGMQYYNVNTFFSNIDSTFSYVLLYNETFDCFLAHTLTDVLLRTKFSVKSDSENLWGRAPTIHPFSPGEPDYLKNIYNSSSEQRTWRKPLSNFFDTFPPQFIESSNNSSTFDYLRSNFNHIRRNKAYSFYILENPSKNSSEIVGSFSNPDDPDYLVNQTGLSTNYTGYIEVWTFNSDGTVTLEPNLIEVPVFGTFVTEGSGDDFSFSDILCEDIIFDF